MADLVEAVVGVAAFVAELVEAVVGVTASAAELVGVGPRPLVCC